MKDMEAAGDVDGIKQASKLFASWGYSSYSKDAIDTGSLIEGKQKAELDFKNAPLAEYINYAKSLEAPTETSGASAKVKLNTYIKKDAQQKE